MGLRKKKPRRIKKGTVVKTKLEDLEKSVRSSFGFGTKKPVKPKKKPKKR